MDETTYSGGSERTETPSSSSSSDSTTQRPPDETVEANKDSNTKSSTDGAQRDRQSVAVQTEDGGKRGPGTSSEQSKSATGGDKSGPVGATKNQPNSNQPATGAHVIDSKRRAATE